MVGTLVAVDNWHGMLVGVLLVAEEAKEMTHRAYISWGLRLAIQVAVIGIFTYMTVSGNYPSF